ncbi:hypothetical protein XBI1_1950020 [Xenorhabdus bovienii str. Intermedium]|uniref:Uncharacterized protein n=1 Tax=Xenorhabdus bovienii str. Intermedium TaxID=1379677 RepID=A0A077QH46_XENBV|nr:hypothetical protein XBI1_1950020 [Xenorhabdus bovienii str. Intermedium]
MMFVAGGVTEYNKIPAKLGSTVHTNHIAKILFINLKYNN